MKYRLDENNDLRPGDELTFAYSGSGVAMLVDDNGTGYRVAAGQHNLAEIRVNEDGSESLVLRDLGPEPKAPAPEAHEAVSEAPASPEAIPYGELSREALRALAKSRGISFKGNPSKATLTGLLETHDAEGTDPAV